MRLQNATDFRSANQGKLMIFGLFRKNKPSQSLMVAQYGALAATAREPAFFLKFNVPDTVLGRFEMLSIALILYFRRTARAGEATKAIAQDLVDAFFEDLDHSFRELGIGDSGVPKRMKRFAAMFYGRLDSYGKALDAQDASELAIALRRNIHPENTDPSLDMMPLASYMLRAEADLAAQPEAQLERGEARLPNAEYKEV